MKKLLPLILIIVLASCTSQPSEQPIYPSEFQDTVGSSDLRIGDSTAILHVIALNAGKGTGHAFVITLTGMDTANAGKILRQLKYMNQQGSHGAPYPSLLYPNDSIFYNGQGKICELWVSSTQAQITAGSKDWIQLVCDTGYAAHTHLMENARGRKLIYPNL